MPRQTHFLCGKRLTQKKESLSLAPDLQAYSVRSDFLRTELLRSLLSAEPKHRNANAILLQSVQQEQSMQTATTALAKAEQAPSATANSTLAATNEAIEAAFSVYSHMSEQTNQFLLPHTRI